MEEPLVVGIVLAVAWVRLRYRGRASAADAKCLVRLWNDDVTTQALVMQILVGELGLGATEARDVTLRIHLQGSSTIGPLPREAAEACVAAATATARAAGAPVRIALETPGHEGTPSVWHRWFRR